MPFPATSHEIGDIFDVRLALGNTSEDANSLAPISVNVVDGSIILACTDPACLAVQQLSGILKFLPRNANGCEQSDPCVAFCSDTRCFGGSDDGKACRTGVPADCGAPGVCDSPTNQGLGDQVYARMTPACVLAPAGATNIARFRVQQVGLPPAANATYFEEGTADYLATAGTCGNFAPNTDVCDNANDQGTCDVDLFCHYGSVVGDVCVSDADCLYHCSADNNLCDWSGLVGSGTGTTQLTARFCGDGIVSAADGETCDPLASATNPSPPSNCRNDMVNPADPSNCTFCGDGLANGPETCDPNNAADPNHAICRGPSAGAAGTSGECTYCGDGVLQPTAPAPIPNEQCDNDGSNCTPTNPGTTCTCSTACLPCAQVTLGNVIWNDTNHNGVRDAGEPGIPNVDVQILDCSGNVITTVQTNAGGLYAYTAQVCDPSAVNLVISVDTNQAALAGFVHTLVGVGNAATDSDCGKGDNANQSLCTVLTVASPTSLSIDCGFFVPFTPTPTPTPTSTPTWTPRPNPPIPAPAMTSPSLALLVTSLILVGLLSLVRFVRK